MKLMKSKVVALVLAVAMVLSVIAVPASAATTQPTTTTAAATWLKSVNLLQGDDSGNLMLDQNLTREQMMVIVSRLLGAEASAKVYPTTTMTFKDVPAGNWAAGYVAWAQAEGITQGYNADKFGFGDALTPWQTAAFMVRALGYVDTPDDEIEAKADLLGILDNSTVNSDIAATAPILRGDMALLMSNALYAETSEGTILGEDLEVLDGVGTLTMSAVASSAQSFKVTFSGAVADTAAATFAVKKDDVAVNVSSTAWNTAKTEATLTMVSKLSEGSYTITVGGVTLVASSATVAIVDEENTKIVFATDKAILGDGLGVAVDDAYTFVKIYNQYGEDVTEDEEGNLTYTVTGGTADELGTDDGTIELVSGATAYEADDVLVVTALDETSGAFAKATLTVVDKASADSVTVAQMYNDDEDAVLEPSATGFELLLVIKDQYGLEMDAANADPGLVISSSDEDVVTVGALEDEDDTVVEDKDYVGLPLTIGADDGVATIRFISNTTGKITTYNVTVKPASEVDTITLTNPTIAVAGEDIDFAVTAYDTTGALITSAADLNNADTGVEITSLSGITDLDETDATFVKEDGKLYLRVDAALADVYAGDADDTDNNQEYDTMNMILTTATNKVVQKSVKVYEPAIPVVVAKVQGIKTGIVEGNTSEIEISDVEEDNNVIIYDQYDRAMDISDFFATGYDVRFAVADDTNVDVDGSDESILTGVGTVDLGGVAKGSEVVTVDLLDAAAAEVADSGYEFTATVVEVADIVSYNVEAIDTVYAETAPEAAYQVDVDVYGVLSNGAKVALPDSLYSIVSGTTGLTVPAVAKLAADSDDVTFATDSKTATGTITITIGGADGPVTLNPTVTISKATPVATTFDLVEVADGEDADALADVTVNGDTVTISAANVIDIVGAAPANGIARLLAAIEVTDQFGVTIVDGSDANAVPVSIIFSNANDADDGDDLALTNGDALGLGAVGSAKVVAAADDTFTMTAVYANGKSFTFNVVVE